MQNSNTGNRSIHFSQNQEQALNHDPSIPLNQYLSIEDKNFEEAQAVVEGHWSQDQNVKYAVFIHLHQQIFSSKTKRKNVQIFKKLSEYLGTRTPRQCRSHFQKLIYKFGTVTKIRNYWKKEIGTYSYDQYYATMRDQLSLHKLDQKESTNSFSKQTVQIGIQTEPMFDMNLQIKQCSWQNYYGQQFPQQYISWPIFPNNMLNQLNFPAPNLRNN